MSWSECRRATSLIVHENETTAMSKLVNATAPISFIYDSTFRTLTEKHEHGAEIELSLRAELVLIDSQHHVRTD